MLTDKYLEISEFLANIEKRENIRILCAVESGSRVWGFESPDSDYDVRFIYLRPRKHYVSIDVENKSDTISSMSGDIDAVGWDFRKSLKLFYAANPPLIEWLTSPYQYTWGRSEPGSVLIEEMRLLIPHFFSRERAYHHYYHMARNNFREFFGSSGDLVKLKKHFYVLRPLYAIQWMELHGTFPPLDFEALKSGVPYHGDDVDKLLDIKRNCPEVKMVSRNSRVIQYMENNLTKYANSHDAFRERKKSEKGLLDNLYRDAVDTFALDHPSVLESVQAVKQSIIRA